MVINTSSLRVRRQVLERPEFYEIVKQTELVTDYVVFAMAVREGSPPVSYWRDPDAVQGMNRSQFDTAPN